jgi:hypothetical protein
MRLPATTVQLLPQTAWQFTPETPRITGSGWLQGAALPVGRGRVAVFGEAAMFTAQLAGAERRPAGMNSPTAPQNHRFALNVVRWLAGVLDEGR